MGVHFDARDSTGIEGIDLNWDCAGDGRIARGLQDADGGRDFLVWVLTGCETQRQEQAEARETKERSGVFIHINQPLGDIIPTNTYSRMIFLACLSKFITTVDILDAWKTKIKMLGVSARIFIEFFK